MKYLSLFLLTILFLMPVTAQTEQFNPTVYTPNGTKYFIHILAFKSATNTTTEESLGNSTMEITGEFMIHSRFLTAGYQAWGFSINLTSVEKTSNEEPKINKIENISIPPVFAIKENTRKIYPTTILIKIMNGEYEDPADAVKDLSNNQPVEGFYVYNPFYIPINVQVGDKIPYGYFNETSSEGIIFYGSIKAEKTININGKTYETWQVDLLAGLQDLMQKIGDFGDNDTEEFNFGNETELLFYYEKETGWLMQIKGFFENTETKNDTQCYMKLDVDIHVEDLGNIVVAGETFIDRFLGAPAGTTLVLGFIGVIAAIIIVIQRLRR